MDYNLISNIKNCYVEIPSLLYYSHIPPAILILILGFFVLFQNRENKLAGKILFSISILFSLWVLLEGAIWLLYSSKTMSFLWSFLGLLYVLLHMLCLYFIYVFIEKKDISFKNKIILSSLLLPLIILTPTKYNIGKFDETNCQSIEGSYFIEYRYILGIFFLIWIISFLIYKYRKAQKDYRKQIALVGLGTILFLLVFSWSEIAGSITENFEITQYGLFGMPILVSFLAYLIVKFQAFNIKMFGAQALVVGLVILIGSQFFFVRNFTNQILTGITLVLAVVFGWALIRSIKIEVERKNQLQEMSNRLAQANDQLRKLDNAKSEFISIASHQLRTPLTAIKGFISLILEGSYGKINAEIKDVLNKVYLSNERLIELVEDLLNLSRIESGRMEYKFEKINLGEVCQEIYDTFVLRAKEKNLDLDLVLDKNLMMEAVTDRNKIREVISNLVDNGLKYTLKGGVKIKLTEIEEKIQIAIIDTGIGVPEEEIPYLFSKFSRGKDISRLNAGGTGLGLHVGKKMIEALGGRIWVQSAGTNLGSTFFMEVPKERGEEN